MRTGLLIRFKLALRPIVGCLHCSNNKKKGVRGFPSFQRNSSWTQTGLGNWWPKPYLPAMTKPPLPFICLSLSLRAGCQTLWWRYGREGLPYYLLSCLPAKANVILPSFFPLFSNQHPGSVLFVVARLRSSHQWENRREWGFSQCGRVSRRKRMEWEEKNPSNSVVDHTGSKDSRSFFLDGFSLSFVCVWALLSSLLISLSWQSPSLCVCE